MEYRILGSLRVLDGGREINLGGAKQKALLAILLLNANEAVSVDRLIDEIWGEEPPASAANVVQVYASKLRKALNGATAALETRRPGYMLTIATDEIDARKFERLVGQARKSAAEGEPAGAVQNFEEATAHWHGTPLADFAYEPFAQNEIQRLTELHLSAIEDRFDAELALGHGPELVANLEALVLASPLRERLRGQLMRSLYRAGRQAQALNVYQDAHRALAEELGIDPSPELQELERMILRHDPALAAGPRQRSAAQEPRHRSVESSILVVPRDPTRMESLLAVAGSLAASSPAQEIILARLIGPWEDSAPPRDDAAVREASADLGMRADKLAGMGVPCRVTAFTSLEPAEDFRRLSEDEPVSLILIDGDVDVFDPAAPFGLRPVSASIGCDIAVLMGADRAAGEGDPIVALFGGGDHEWAALQMAAVLAKGRDATLRLVGSAADLRSGTRDASRLLGTASLVVQRLTNVIAEPSLVEPGGGVLHALDGAGLVVFGVSDRWPAEGLGSLRTAIVEQAPSPVLVLRRGPRSTAPARREGQSRYAWSRAGGITAPMPEGRKTKREPR